VKEVDTDFESAFVQSEVDEEMYMSLTDGYEYQNNKGETLYLKLHKSLYGLKQAPRNWNIKLTNRLINHGFHQSKIDPCFFYYKRENVLHKCLR